MVFPYGGVRKESAMSETVPRFVSTAFDDIPRPDFADVSIQPLPPGAPTDPEVWARTVFDLRHGGPQWVRVLMGLRQALVGLIGVPRGDSSAFEVRGVRGEEALLAVDDRHLDWRAAVGVDAEAGLVRMVTTVRLHGLRGRLYFTPVALLHPPVVRAMLRSAARRLTP
jgi:hypothetical protein